MLPRQNASKCTIYESTQVKPVCFLFLETKSVRFRNVEYGRTMDVKR